jgi:hypothetical protein
MAIVVGENSYITAVEAKAYATDRGVTLPDNIDSMLIQSFEYLESFADRFKGEKTNLEQTAEWPRTNVEIGGLFIASDAYPKQLKNAQAQLVIELNNGVELWKSYSGRAIQSKSIGAVSTTYAAGGSSAHIVNMPKFDMLLKPLLASGGSVVFIRK